jgi:hypothetical protein
LGAICRWFGALTSTLSAWLRPSRWHAWAHSGRRALPSAGWAVETNEGRPRCGARLVMLQRYGASLADARLQRLSLPTGCDLQRTHWRPQLLRVTTHVTQGQAYSCPGMGEHIDSETVSQSLRRSSGARSTVVLHVRSCHGRHQNYRRPVSSGGQRRIAYRPILSVTVTWGETPPPPAPAPPTPRRGPGPGVPGDCPREEGPPAAGSPPS